MTQRPTHCLRPSVGRTSWSALGRTFTGTWPPSASRPLLDRTRYVTAGQPGGWMPAWKVAVRNPKVLAGPSAVAWDGSFLPVERASALVDLLIDEVTGRSGRSERSSVSTQGTHPVRCNKTPDRCDPSQWHPTPPPAGSDSHTPTHSAMASCPTGRPRSARRHW